MRLRVIIPTLVSLVLLAPASAFCAAGAGMRLDISPGKITIDTYYHGTDLTLHGKVPAHSDIALVVMSGKEELDLMKKGKAGPLWMNVGTITIRNVPVMYYLVTSTRTEEELAPEDVLETLDIGYGALQESMTIEPPEADRVEMFREFIKLKESMGMYGTLHGIELENAGMDSARFSVSLPIPASVTPGEYTVFLYCFENGNPSYNSSRTLIIEKTGLPKRLSGLASEHSALYGVVAIAVAVSAGLFIGFIFGLRRRSG